MKLSIWHCQVLYCMSNKMDLLSVAKTAEVSVKLLEQHARSDNWAWKKEKFQSLSEDNKNDLDRLELLFGDFIKDSGKKEFINTILKKIKASKRDQDIANIKKQYASQLTEFGLSEQDATQFINQIERGLAASTASAGASTSLLDGEEIEISIRDKIDALNSGYRFLVESQSRGIADCHDILLDAIKLQQEMMLNAKRAMPKSFDIDEINAWQRAMNFSAQSLSRLIGMYFEVSGSKTHVNHHSAIAKLFSQGYLVMRREEIGRLANANGN